MWALDITIDQAHKLFEIILLVLPIFMLSYLVADRDEIARASGVGEPAPPGVDEQENLDTQWFRLGMPNLFLISAAISFAASIPGVLFTPQQWLMALAVTTFWICFWQLFATVQNRLLDDRQALLRTAGRGGVEM